MKATVAYEASRRRPSKAKDAVKPLKWHHVQKSGYRPGGGRGILFANGEKGVYRIEEQRPDRRHGVFKYVLSIAKGSSRIVIPALLNGKPISCDLIADVKEAAAIYDAMPQSVPVAIVASEASDRYCKAVRAKLVALGSPNPDGDIKHSAQYLHGTERAGIDPGVAAAVIDATMHHAHPPHAQFTLEAHEEAAAREDSAYEERLTQAERDNLPASDFALPERRELLIDTAARTRNAPARLEMMHHQRHVTPVEYSQAKRRIAARSKHFGIESRYAAEESPTSTEWEVIVTNPPAQHRGAILAQGMGETEEVGNKIILRGFHDDEQASRTASSIARTYKVQVTFGPRNPLYEVAEEAALPRGDAKHWVEVRTDVYIRDDAAGVRYFINRRGRKWILIRGNGLMTEIGKYDSLWDAQNAGDRMINNPDVAGEGARTSHSFDADAATELELYADNTAELYKQKEAIISNLKKKMAKGVYDKEKATKLWMYWVDAAAKRYVKEFGGGTWHEVFGTGTRIEIARREEKKERAEMQLEMGHMRETPNPLA